MAKTNLKFPASSLLTAENSLMFRQFKDVLSSSYTIGYGGDNLFCTCSELKAKKDGIINSLSVITENNTSMIISIGTIESNVYTERIRKTFNIKIEQSEGIFTINPNMQVYKDEYVGIIGLNSKFGFDNNSTALSSKFIQAPLAGETGSYVELDGYISLSYNIYAAEFSNATESIKGLEEFTGVNEQVTENAVFENVLSAPYQIGFGGDDIITTCSELQATKAGFINRISIVTQDNTPIVFAIGTIEYGYFKERIRRVITAQLDEAEGIFTFNPFLEIFENEWIGIIGTASKFGFKVNDATLSTKFFQFPILGQTATEIERDGYLSIAYNIIPADVRSSLHKVSGIVDGYNAGEITEGENVIANSYYALAGNAWASFAQNNTIVEGFLEKIEIDVEEAGEITIGIGIIDQRGWAIIDEEIVLNASQAGVNTIETNIRLTKGKRLFIKGPQSIGLLNSTGYFYATSSGEIELIQVAGKLAFNYSLFGYSYTDERLVTKEDLTSIDDQLIEIDNKINSLSLNNILISSPGKTFKLLCDDSGNLSTQEIINKKISVFGNSIEKHPITSFWWGEWGMAASKREKDWVHQLSAFLLGNGIPSTNQVLNIATWETNAAGFDYSVMDGLLVDPDLVIVRIGENNPNTATLTDDTITLINYIKTQVPGVKIIFGGLFWTNESKQLKLKSAIDTFPDIDFIDFQDLDINDNKSAIGNLVYGDDSVWHTIDSSGVANHPGDNGHKAMAERLLPYALSLLS